MMYSCTWMLKSGSGAYVLQEHFATVIHIISSLLGTYNACASTSTGQVLATSSVWPLQSTERSKSLTGSLQWDCGTICNSQDERGEVRLNKKVTVSLFLTDTSPDENNTGTVITKRPSMEDLQVHTL